MGKRKRTTCDCIAMCDYLGCPYWLRTQEQKRRQAEKQEAIANQQELDEEIAFKDAKAKELLEQKKFVALAYALHGRHMQREKDEKNLQLFPTPDVSLILEDKKEKHIWFPDDPYENWEHCYPDKTPLPRLHTFPFEYPLLSESE